MAEIPSTRAQWRAWVRTVNPGEVRRRAGVRQADLAARISTSSGTRVAPGSLGGWERGAALPREHGHGAAWHEAVAEMASVLKPGR